MTAAAIKATFSIPLTKGRHAIVDAADYELVSRFKWHLMEGSHTGYAARVEMAPRRPGVRKSGTTIRMHRLILGCGAGDIVDHINGDGLDNRRANLRLVTHAQNCQNRVSVRRDNSSGANGVSFHKPTGRWRAYITRDGKRRYLGGYASNVEAAAARKAAEQ